MAGREQGKMNFSNQQHIHTHFIKYVVRNNREKDFCKYNNITYEDNVFYKHEDLKTFVNKCIFERIGEQIDISIKTYDVKLYLSNNHICCPKCKTELEKYAEEENDIFCCPKCKTYTFFHYSYAIMKEDYFRKGLSDIKEIKTMKNSKKLKKYLRDFFDGAR